MYLFSIFDILPNRSLPPLEWGFGVNPSVMPQACFQHDAARSRAVLKPVATGKVAARTLEVVGPMPGQSPENDPRIVFRPGSYLQATRDSIGFRGPIDLGGHILDLDPGIAELLGRKPDRIERIGGQASGRGQRQKPLDVLHAVGGNQAELAQMGTSRRWRAFSTTRC